MNEAGAADLSVEVGRRVRFEAGYGNISDNGVIVAVHDEPGTVWDLGLGRSCGPQPIRVSVDVVLDDGRRLNHMTSIGRPGIGIKLRPIVADLETVRRAKQRNAEYEGDQVIAKAKAKFDFERAEAARVITDPPLFYWNGIKDAKGAKLQKCWYSKGRWTPESGLPDATIGIYARDYDHFSAKVRDCFVVTNDTDSQVDYFDTDDIRVLPVHPLYAQVKAAWEAQEAHRDARAAKWNAKRGVAA